MPGNALAARERSRTDASAAAAFDAAVGRELGDRYCITGILARSPDTVLYGATDVSLARPVALRVLDRRALVVGGREELLNRALASAAALDHPHVVRVYESGTTPGLLWYATRYVEGISLAAMLRERGTLEASHCLRMAEQIASALQYAHRMGVVHGGLCAERVLVQNEEWVLVSDFATGAILDAAPDSMADPSTRRLTTAPETATDRDVGPAADQYALAVLLYECLLGSVPDPDADAAPAEASADAEESGTTAMPIHMSLAFRRAMSPRPMDRFPTVLDFVGALTAADGARALFGPPRARDVVEEQQRMVFVADQPKPRRWVGATAALALLCVGGIVATQMPRHEAIAVGPVADGAMSHAWDERQTPPVAEATPPELQALTLGATDGQSDRAASTIDSTPATPRPAPQRRQQPTRTQTTPARAAAVPTPPPLAAPEAPGRLLVNSYPWGQLSVDGRPVGTTPFSNPIPAGTHTIRITQDGYRPVDRVVTVGPGQEVRITDLTLESSP